jgi:hypothetical protein
MHFYTVLQNNTRFVPERFQVLTTERYVTEFPAYVRVRCVTPGPISVFAWIATFVAGQFSAAFGELRGRCVAV